ALIGAGLAHAESREALAATQGAIGACLARHRERTGVGVVLFIDQFEELVTLAHDPDERARFCRELGGVVADDGARVVVTLRDDFLVAAAGLPWLDEHLSTSLEILAAPPPEDLARIL